ncbi:hypothetical protein A8U91_01460 [Halomonas elongata]|uniref:Uncharacterized protein n=1 Tax=Halomonas elongata TaxID=2746 RepID=A0A1B8P4B5_HALEL|nr:hypothetical protein A8U91_01460 [Halomonas elongata]
MVRLLRGNQRMACFTPGHGQQAQLAQGLDNDGIRVGALQCLNGQRGQQELGRGPVGTLEEARLFHLHGARLDRRAPAFLKHRPASRVQYLGELAGFGEVRGLGQLTDGGIQLGQQGGELAIVIGRLAVVRVVRLRRHADSRSSLFVMTPRSDIEIKFFQ